MVAPLTHGQQSSVIQRRLADGTAYQIVKVPHTSRLTSNGSSNAPMS